MPKMNSELYAIDYNSKKPRYRPSVKHRGFFVSLKYNQEYNNDNFSHTMFFKVGSNGKMLQAGLLNLK